MKTLKTIAVYLLLAGAVAQAAERAQSIIHVSHIGTSTVGITCANGADPTGIKSGEVLLISCGK